KTFAKEFRVLTALSGPEGEEILGREDSLVGIVITDQRMPEQTGVEFLARIRRSRPDIVRMLTTAYSDLDAAIKAVNSGAILKYVAKPWNLQELRGALLRGMEFFLVRQERDTLLRERLSILQGFVIADRVRSLGVLAAGLSHHIRNPMTPLRTFLDLAPRMLKKELPEQAQAKKPEFWEGLRSSAQKGMQRILQMINEVGEAVVEPGNDFDNHISLHDLVKRAVESLKEEKTTSNISLRVDIAPDLPPFKANAAMMERLFKVLLREAIRLNATERNLTLRIRETLPVWGTEGAKVIVTRDGP
ncbi:MAG: response regulator, partial [Deltaproteobacteria bacterium]|nr:response regulator [Deltaproteobacteria bacterium]